MRLQSVMNEMAEWEREIFEKEFSDINWIKGKQAKHMKEIEQAKSAKEALENEKKQYGKEVKAAEKSVAEVNAQRDQELKKGGKFKQLEEKVSELGKTVAKVKTQVEIKDSTIADEEEKIASSEKELEEVSRYVPSRQARCLSLTTASRERGK